MENRKKIMAIRKQHKDAVRAYADLKTGYYIVEDNNILPEELIGECDLLRKIYEGDYVSKKDVGKVINFYERIMSGREKPLEQSDIEVIVDLKDREGNYSTVSLVCYIDTDADGLVTGYVATVRPLRKKEIEERVILSSFTSDKNPSVYVNKIASFMKANPEREYAFIQFDVRNFRYINEKYGSDKGDEVLAYISDTLDILCDENHLHCRLTADMYQVVTYYNSREEILNFIDMIDLRLHRYQNIRFSMSYGISVAPGTSTEYRKHGDEAGLARIENKRVILKKAVFYEDTLMVNVKKSGAIEEIEEEALKNGEFHVYLQPKYQYDKLAAKIIGAEALVRWIDSEGKVKSPAEFIPVFEKNGFLLEVDKYMWESVCRLIRGWIDDNKPVVPISVNVSRSYFRKINLVKYLTSLIEKYDIPIEYFQLEITETTESDDTLAYVTALKEAGFTLLMDDFGSGFSSLSMLRETPFDVIKMDRQFLVECLDNKNGRTIVSHMISMSNEMGLDLIAEGVETKSVADFLFDSGCSVSQGFYFSKPVSVYDFEKLCFA